MITLIVGLITTNDYDDYDTDDKKLTTQAEELSRSGGATIFLRDRSGEYATLDYFICGNQQKISEGLAQEIPITITQILDNPSDIYNKLKEFARLDKVQLKRLDRQKQKDKEKE